MRLASVVIIFAMALIVGGCTQPPKDWDTHKISDFNDGDWKAHLRTNYDKGSLFYRLVLEDAAGLESTKHLSSAEEKNLRKDQRDKFWLGLGRDFLCDDRLNNIEGAKLAFFNKDEFKILEIPVTLDARKTIHVGGTKEDLAEANIPVIFETNDSIKSASNPIADAIRWELDTSSADAPKRMARLSIGDGLLADLKISWRDDQLYCKLHLSPDKSSSQSFERLREQGAGQLTMECQDASSFPVWKCSLMASDLATVVGKEHKVESLEGTVSGPCARQDYQRIAQWTLLYPRTLDNPKEGLQQEPVTLPPAADGPASNSSKKNPARRGISDQGCFHPSAA